MKCFLLIAALVTTSTFEQLAADDQDFGQPEMTTLRDQGAIFGRVRPKTKSSDGRITAVYLGRHWSGGDQSLKIIPHYSVMLLSLHESPKVSDSTLEALRGLEAKYVKLQYVQITDKGLGHVATMTGLKTVTLKSVPVTDAGILALTKLKSLKRLNLWGTKVTIDGVAKLRTALPDCDVRYNSWNRIEQ